MSYIEPEIFRGVERLVTVIFGGMSIYWGFRLFDRSYQSAGAMDAKGGGLSFSIRRVGPGVFFAVFGMAILVSSLNARLDHSRSGSTKVASAAAPASSDTKETQAAQTSERVVFGQGGVVSGRQNRLFDSALSVKETVAYLSNPALPDQPKRAFLIEKLRATKTLLLDERYTPEGIQAFKELRTKIRNDPAALKKLSDDERRQFEMMQSAVED